MNGDERGAEAPFSVLLDRSLSGPLLFAGDVRWLDDEAVALSAIRHGVFRMSAADLEGEPELLVQPGVWTAPRMLGASSRYLVSGIGFGPLGWMDREDEEPGPEAVPVGLVAGLDVQGERLALLGARRGEDGRWSPEGALAFVGSLAEDLEDLTPVAHSIGGPDSQAMARCGLFDVGAIRFLEDGRLLVVPGVEPGVFLYSPEGELLRSWQSEPLGFQDDCDLEEEERLLVARDPEARYRWNRSRVLVQDAFDLGGDPALVLRHPEEGGTSWTLVVLGEDEVRHIPFPVSTESTRSHLRVDRRGDRIAALIVELGALLDNQEAAPRLLVLQVDP